MANEYDQEYVTKLRTEAAEWRTKYRELEANGLYKDVEVEFAKRGITADPTWVELTDGQSVSDGVDALIAKHPNLGTAQTTTTPTQQEVPQVRRPVSPGVMPTGSAHPDLPVKSFSDRTPGEIKKDPVARSKLRDLYRGLLASSSNQPNHKDY